MIKSLKFCFLLGRPGCGKSYLYNNVIVGAFKKTGVKEIERFDDFPILKKLLAMDSEFKRHILKDGGFEVTDWTIVDDVLKEMDRILREKEKEERIVIVEFARDNYEKALANFSDYVREKSILIYIWAPFDTCAASNRKRFEKGTNIDDHIVPESLMRSYYLTDDIDQIFLKERSRKSFKLWGWDTRIFDNSNRDMSPDEKEKLFLTLLEMKGRLLSNETS